MHVERTYQLITPHGVVFDINEFTIPPQQCCLLRTLRLPFVHKAHYRIVESVVELYERMLPGKLPCQMKVAVSRPLTRHQGDLLNEQRHFVSNMVGTVAGKSTATVVGGPLGLMGGMVAGGIAAFAVSQLAKEKIPTFHMGDVLVSLSAQVKGGIGPQSSSVLLII